MALASSVRVNHLDSGSPVAVNGSGVDQQWEAPRTILMPPLRRDVEGRRLRAAEDAEVFDRGVTAAGVMTVEYDAELHFAGGGQV